MFFRHFRDFRKMDSTPSVFGACVTGGPDGGVVERVADKFRLRPAGLSGVDAARRRTVAA